MLYSLYHAIKPYSVDVLTSTISGDELVNPQRKRDGGAREDRTPDLLRARQALSQLSYGP